MQLALISDIHGNAIAFQAVLQQLERKQIDHIICLGDAIATGPQPAECVALLQQHRIPAILGNADAWLLKPQRAPDASEFHRFIEEIDSWCKDQLRPADLSFISEFKPTLEYSLSGYHTLLAYHGSPISFDVGIHPETADAVLDELLPAPHVTVMAGGHTHQPFLRRHLDLTILNPGAIGLGYQHKRATRAPYNIGWAEYAVIEIDSNAPEEEGNLDIEFCRVPYSLAELRRVALESTMPKAERWISGWIDH